MFCAQKLCIQRQARAKNSCPMFCAILFARENVKVSLKVREWKLEPRPIKIERGYSIRMGVS